MKKLKDYSKEITTQAILKNAVIYSTLANLLVQLNASKKPFSEHKHFYIDVSIFAKNDNKTGIQRVIRELVFQFLKHSELKNKIHFVVATKKNHYKSIDYSINNTQIIFDINHIKEEKISPTANDIFFGLDFCPNIAPYYLTDFIKWKLEGVKFVWLLHDLLPLTHPQWFTQNNTQNFLNWFKTVLLTANQILCVSQTVKNQIIAYTGSHQYPYPQCCVIPLGYRFNTENTIILYPNCLQSYPYVLMVSTLEPRKGHSEIIQVFTQYWQENLTDIKLILVGKAGWHIEGLIKDIEKNEFYNKNLFWLKDVKDEQLISLYQDAAGTIMASLDEGFGLPLIEAIAMNKHILVRDIPIFREVGMAKNNLTYFNSENLFRVGNLWLNEIIKLPTQINHFSNTTDFGWQQTFNTILSTEL